MDDLLGLEPPPPDEDLPRGAVPYLPCGVAEILTFVDETPVQPHDVVVDLGAGLGRVAMLVHLLTGARTRGIEIQQHLVTLARERCAALGIGLPGIDFTHADVAAGSTPLDGSIFFLYAPFNGALLTRVLARLAEVASRRRIVVATVDLELMEHEGTGWLRPRAPSSPSVHLYDSR